MCTGDGGGLIKEHTKGNLDRKHQYVLYVFLFAPGGVNGGSLPLTLDYFLSHEGAFSVADRFKIGTFLFFFFPSHFPEAVVLDSYSKVIARESG